MSSNLGKMNLELDNDRVNLMEFSVFSKLVKIKNFKQSSGSLILCLTRLFDGNNSFSFNSDVHFKFCVEEVASVLGIENAGIDYVSPKNCNSVPDYLKCFEIESGEKKELRTSLLRAELKNMKIENENDRIVFRKLLTLFIIDQLLLPSTNYQFVQTKFFWLADELEFVNKVNWVKAVFDHLVTALNSAKKFLREGKGKEHVFTGATPVLEAIIFSRISKIAPDKLGLDPPIQNFKSKRQKVSDCGLANLTNDEILPCSLCPVLLVEVENVIPPRSSQAISLTQPPLVNATSSSAGCSLAASFETMTIKEPQEPQRSESAMVIGTMMKDLSSVIMTEDFLELLRNKLKNKANFAQYLGYGERREFIRQENSDVRNYKKVVDEQQKQVLELKSSLESTKLEVNKAQLQWDEEIKKLENHVRSLEEENRQLYNQVQDLKGSIRVFCRVRPFLEGQSDVVSTVSHIEENGSIMIVNPKKQGRDARKVYSFNKVFGANATQQQIYADTQSLIRSVLDGFNVCIFAYGQTGSGKTYTMTGPDLVAEDTWGVNYRALQDLFHISKSRVGLIEYEIRVQMIEIYNEQVRDLLVFGSSRRLDVRNNSLLDGLNVPGACLVQVNCTQDVLDLMQTGLKNRVAGATALNEKSSRSHSIMTIHVQGKELTTGSIMRGCLNLVDLAGSERVDKSEVFGERLKEAQHINKSLSALGDVISALAQKSAHIPYRNSKLTQVLQDSLGGQAKTVMFVHINPVSNAIGETISTLNFAERVASVHLGAARANKETTELRDLKAEISNLKSALEMKEAELEHLKCANVRSISETQNARAISPMHVPRPPRPGNKAAEVSSCPPGKQRSHLPSGFNEHKAMPKMLLIAEEKLTKPGNPRSPSPLARLSVNKPLGTTSANPLVDRHEQSKHVNTRQLLSVGKSKQEMNKFKAKNQSAPRMLKLDESDRKD